MNDDKYLDELFSSAKKQDSILNEIEINSILENANVPIVNKFFGVNKMSAIIYTAAAVVIGYFGIINLSDNQVPQIEKPIELTKKVEKNHSTNYNSNEDVLKPIIKDSESTFEKEGPREVQKSNDIVINDSKKFKSNEPKKEEKIEYKSFNVIKLNEDDLKNIGVIVDGNKVKFSFDEKDDKAMVVTLMDNTSFNIKGGKPLKSITPKFVSGKNGNKIMSFFDDNKNTLAYRTSKTNESGQKQVTTVLRKNHDNDNLDIHMKIDHIDFAKNFNDSILIHNPENLDKMLIKKFDYSIEEKMPVNLKNLNIEQLINNNSVTYSIDDGSVITKYHSDSNSSNQRVSKRVDVVNITGVKDKFLMPDENGDLVWTENKPNTNFVMVQKTENDGKTVETRIENKVVNFEQKNINIDSVLEELNITVDSLQKKIDNKMLIIQSKIDDSNKKIDKANDLKSHLKSMALNESVENYFDHDINKLIPVEIKFDGENLDYVLWFEPTMELLERLPSNIQEKLRMEFEILQNENTAFCGEAPIQNPISDKWNGCNGAIKNLKLSPIPTQSELNYSFELNDNRTLDITITDINGTKLNIESSNNTYPSGFHTNKLDVSKLSPGIYYLTIISSSGEIVNQRFLKE